MSTTERAVIPDGVATHRDEELATSTDRVRRLRDKALHEISSRRPSIRSASRSIAESRRWSHCERPEA